MRLVLWSAAMLRFCWDLPVVYHSLHIQTTWGASANTYKATAGMRTLGFHYSDITWDWWYLKSQATCLFVQQIAQANNIETLKLHITSPSKGIPVDYKGHWGMSH